MVRDDEGSLAESYLDFCLVVHALSHCIPRGIEARERSSGNTARHEARVRFPYGSLAGGSDLVVYLFCVHHRDVG
jgi:hypothetical protein